MNLHMDVINSKESLGDQVEDLGQHPPHASLKVNLEDIFTFALLTKHLINFQETHLGIF